MAEKIVVQTIIQIAGKPADLVEKTLHAVSNKLRDEKKAFKMKNVSLAKPEFDEETKMFSGFLDITLQFSNISDILGFIVDYTPTSIEIVEPETIELDAITFGRVLNDICHQLLQAQSKVQILSAQLHHLVDENKRLKSEIK